MLRIIRNVNTIQNRTFKNFGHKRQPVPMPTIVWHGFLTFTFVALGLKWDFINKIMFGSEDYDKQIDEKFRGNITE